MRQLKVMKKWAGQNKLYLVGAAAGAVVGYLYNSLVGCETGTCRITSSPLNSTVYFALVGALFLGLFLKQKPARPDKEI